ncbi:MAG: zinc-ribbon domain-containing protein [Bryobacteraceae bacterium]
MAYCSQCGTPVEEADLYCSRCGARQPRASASDALSGINPRTAAILCYVPIVGWVAAVIVLAAEKFRNDRAVRFHAFQGLYLFVAWLIVDQVLSPMLRAAPGPSFGVDKILHLALIAIWVFMMIQAAQERLYSLPIIGELAERSVAER